MTSGYLPSTVGGGDLVAELASMATQAGPNAGLWPGLTIYRFTGPAGPTWEEIQSLSLCIVAQGPPGGDRRRPAAPVRPVPLPGPGQPPALPGRDPRGVHRPPVPVLRAPDRPRAGPPGI